jgi:predicted small metal-binding protein
MTWSVAHVETGRSATVIHCPRPCCQTMPQAACRCHHADGGDHAIPFRLQCTCNPYVHTISETEDPMKQFACGDIVPGCSATYELATEDEILAAVATHAREAHGIDAVPDQMVAEVKSRIRDLTPPTED